MPEAGGAAITDARHQALQSRDPRQEHFAFYQTRRRELEQDTRPLRTEPRPAIQPPDQAEALAGIMKIAIAIALLNLASMIPMRIARVVVLQARGIVQPELLGHIGHDSGWHVGRIGQKGP